MKQSVLLVALVGMSIAGLQSSDAGAQLTKAQQKARKQNQNIAKKGAGCKPMKHKEQKVKVSKKAPPKKTEVAKVPPPKKVPPGVQVPKDFKPKLPKMDIDLSANFKRDTKYVREKRGTVSVEVSETQGAPAKKSGTSKVKSSGNVASTKKPAARAPASGSVASKGGKSYTLKTPKGNIQLSPEEYKDYQANPAKYNRIYGS